MGKIQLERAKLQERLQQMTSGLDAKETGIKTQEKRGLRPHGPSREGGEFLVCVRQVAEGSSAKAAPLQRFGVGTREYDLLCGRGSATRLEKATTRGLCEGAPSSMAGTRAIGEETRMDIYEKKADLIARINAGGEDRHEMLPELQGLVRELESHGNTISANLKYMLAELEDEAREAEMDNFPV